MKKYVKPILLSLSALYLAGMNLSHATVEPHDPSKQPLATATVAPRGGFAAHQVALTGIGKKRDEDGKGWAGATMAVGGARLDVATRDQSGDEAAQKRHQDWLDAIVFAGNVKDDGTIPEDMRGRAGVIADSRTIAEGQCDMIFFEADAYYRNLLAGLNDFVTGETAKQLVSLAKAVGKLNLDGTPIGVATHLFPALIKKVRGHGEALRGSLDRDVSVILDVLNDVVLDFNFYTQKRSGPTPDLRFQDISGDDPDTTRRTHVGLERVDITDIRDMFVQVERTLRALMDHKLAARLDKMREFLRSVDNLHVGHAGTRHTTDHTVQIRALSEPFRKYEGVFGVIDSKWKSPTNPNLAQFQEGVKYINILIESIAAYAERAKMIAEGTYAEQRLLEGPQATLPGGRVDADTAMTVLTPSLDKAALEQLARNKAEGEWQIGPKIDDIARQVERIETYLAQ